MQTEIKSKKNESRKPQTPRIGLLDRDTGELLDQGGLVYVSKKPRISRFFMARQHGLEYIAKRKLNGEALNVLMLMMSRMEYENAIRISQKEISEILGMKKQNVSRAIKALRDNGILNENINRTPYLDSWIGWKGKVASMREHERFFEEKKSAQERLNLEKAMEEKMAALNQIPASSSEET